MRTRWLTRACWDDVADQLVCDAEAAFCRGDADEFAALQGLCYLLDRKMDCPHWTGRLSLRPENMARIDRAFARLCGVVEEPVSLTAPAALAEVERILKANHA